MSGNEHSTLNIVAYRYVPIGKTLLRIPVDKSAIMMYHNVISEYYTAECQCGLACSFDGWRYLAGLPIHGGEIPEAGLIGVVFGPGHRWIRLHCSRCFDVQWYFKEDELGSGTS